MTQQSDKPHKIGEIAQQLGISASTVSKVINGRPGVSQITRRRIETALHESGYSRPLVSTKVSQTIELVVEYIENNGTIELIKYASRWALQHGIGITITQTDSGRKIAECFRGVIDRNPLGVIVQMSNISPAIRRQLRSRDIPFVIIDPVDPIQDEDMSVSVDNWTGGFSLGQYLVNSGHRRIGIIVGLQGTQSASARYGGVVAAMHRAGIEVIPELVKQGDYLAEQGYEAAGVILDVSDPPTAIVACNDLTAVNVYRAARERGFSLPRQLSVVGFDDVYPAEYLFPSLTTVHQPFDLVTAQAMSMITDVRHGLEIQRHVVLPTRLMVRDSVVPPQQMEHDQNIPAD